MGALQIPAHSAVVIPSQLAAISRQRLIGIPAFLTFIAFLLVVGGGRVWAASGFPVGDAAFHTYAEVSAELSQVAAANPDIARLSSIGTSTQGRQLWLLKISDNVATDEAEPEVLFTGLMHAREHLTVEQSLALIHWLTDGYAADPEVQGIVNGTEVWVMPMLNPDGGEFDIKGGRYHNWRKNRQPNAGSTAVGTDLNRNFPYHWGCCGGSSGNPQAITYRGAQPLSAPEARAERDFVRSRVIGGVQQLRLALSFHSYGAQILYPYGYTKSPSPPDMRPEDYAAMKGLAEGMADLNGYSPIQGSQNYVSSGGFGDWAYGTQRILVFTIELAPATKTDGGFYPAGSRIGELTQANRAALLWFMEQAPCPYDAAGITNNCASTASAAAGSAARSAHPERLN
jgi:carboxypeptidase T